MAERASGTLRALTSVARRALAGNGGTFDDAPRARIFGEEEIAHESAAPQHAVRFRAPTTTWYRLTIDLHGVQKDVDVCTKIR